MHTSPTTALIALLASTAGSLATWYTPSPIPGLIFGVLAYVAVVIAGARLFGLSLDKALLGTTRCTLTALAITLTAILRGCINSLNALNRWDTSALTRTGATAP